MNRRRFVAVAPAAVVAALAWPFSLEAADSPGSTPAPRNRLIIQVSDADPKKWALALNNAKNVQTDLGKGQVDIEIVAYGPGLGMLKLDSEVANRVGEALDEGVTIVACMLRA